MIRRLLLRQLGRRVRAGFAGVGAATERIVPGPQVHGYRLDDPETWRRALNDGAAYSTPAAQQWRCGTPGGGEATASTTAPRRRALNFRGTPAAGDDPAGFLPPDPAGSPPSSDHGTSDLLTAAANQLANHSAGHLCSPHTRAYLDELIPELRDRAAQFAAIGD